MSNLKKKIAKGMVYRGEYGTKRFATPDNEKDLIKFFKKKGEKPVNAKMVWKDLSASKKQKWLDTDKSVKGKKYVAYSPDDFPISHEAKRHSDYGSARKELENWAKNYEHQGYYSTGNREKIPLKDIVRRSKIKTE